MGLRLGSFVTGSVIAVFVVALMVLNSREEDLIAAEGFEAMSPVFTFLIVGAILTATKEDHRTEAQRGLYQNYDTDDGDPDPAPTQKLELDQPHAPGQKEGEKDSRKTRLLGYLKKLDGIEAQLLELKNGEGDGWSKKTNSG